MQVTMQFEAGSAAPRLVRLVGSGGRQWENVTPEKPIAFAIDRASTLPLRWHFDPNSTEIDQRHVRFRYVSRNPRMQLDWVWTARDHAGPIEHTISITNLENREFWIPLQASAAFGFSVPASAALSHFYVEKGAGKPSDVGTHLARFEVGTRWTGKSSTYAHPSSTEPREVIPFLAVKTEEAGGGGWFAGAEWSGRFRLSLQREASILGCALGLDADSDSFRTRLEPGKPFVTPTVFVGAFQGELDDLGNQLRPWVRRVLGNPHAWADPHYPLLVNNSWGSGMEVDETLAGRMIRDSAELGLEMFHVDAGWFRGVGDWVPDPHKFPHGLAAIADNAHGHGLRFGIWTDWTQAGLQSSESALTLRKKEVRDWSVADVPPDWKPEPFKGQTVDIGVPEAQQFAAREVERIVSDYRLDMLEHDGYLVAQGCVRSDHPHAPPDPQQLVITHSDGNFFVESPNSTDVSYHAVRAYYEIHEALRAKHPELLLEVCNDGGRMVDFGSAAHGDYFSITDTYDPVSNRQAFYDASYLLPPAMLECYVQKWPAPRIENFRYMLRSGMLGWLTVMLDTTAWSEAEHSAAKREFQNYRDELRPLIRDANIYHVGPRPNGVHWDGTEYFDPARGRGALVVFHGSDPNEAQHPFAIRGVDPKQMYRIRFFDQSDVDHNVSGSDLLAKGILMHLQMPESSEIVMFEAVPRAGSVK